MTKNEALQICLEYIETDKHERKYVRHAIKAALKQAEQPAQRPWQGLTDEEIFRADPRIETSDSNVNPYQILKSARAIEALQILKSAHAIEAVLKGRNHG